jgi:hypothetical protein
MQLFMFGSDVVTRVEVGGAYDRLASMRRSEGRMMQNVDKDRAGVIVTASAKSGLAAGVAVRLHRLDQSMFSASNAGITAQGWRRPS